jgi:DnaJ-class molecular chaperone
MSSKRTYYVVLGVSDRESHSGIRSAFRDLARRYHPDRVGPRGTAFFQEIVEAYHTLSDPGRRADYDRGLGHAEDVAPVDEARIQAPPRAQAEPLIPDPLLPQPVSLLRDFETGRPSVDEVTERIRRNFFAERLPKSRRLETLEIDVLLRPETALRGGVLAIGVPVFYPCSRCRGTGRLGLHACFGCEGRGLVEDEQQVRLRVVAGVHDGAVYRVPLGGLGIHNLQLVLRVRIAR